MTHYFRFPDEKAGMAALNAAGLLYIDEDGDTLPITASHTHALDVIGSISIGGSYDAKTGDVITPPTLLPGWHCNFIGKLPEDWETFVVKPRHSVRVFA